MIIYHCLIIFGMCLLFWFFPTSFPKKRRIRLECLVSNFPIVFFGIFVTNYNCFRFSHCSMMRTRFCRGQKVLWKIEALFRNNKWSRKITKPSQKPIWNASTLENHLDKRRERFCFSDSLRRLLLLYLYKKVWRDAQMSLHDPFFF